MYELVKIRTKINSHNNINSVDCCSVENNALYMFISVE